LKFYLKICLALIALTAAITYYLASQNTAVNNTNASKPAQLQLVKIGEKCLDFGDRAVASDMPIVEFQMIVRLAKKTDVIRNCMTDNGYQQNAAWLKYAQPIIKAEAVKANISIDEATTSLSRKHMQVFTHAANQPAYWVKKAN
jgi:hypothetical protein